MHVFSKSTSSALAWNDYRLGDGVARRADAPGCERYPNSIVCLYSKETNKSDDVEALIRVLENKSWKFDVAEPKTAIIHVRLGDGLCAESDERCRGKAQGSPDCWNDNRDCWYDSESSTKQYAYSKSWYISILRDLQEYHLEKIIVLGDKHHWTRTEDPRNGDFSVDDAYINNVADYFRSVFPHVEIRESALPDQDFLLMCSANIFVQGGGGYSALIAQVVEKRGGVVLKPKQPADLFQERSGLQGYYINLAARTDRRYAVENQLIQTGMVLDRINAVDVRKNESALEGCWDKNELSLCAGKIGVKLSHLKALDAGEASGRDVVAIFEDDFAWLPHTDPKKVLDALSAVRDACPDWNVIALSMNIMKKERLYPNISLSIGPGIQSKIVKLTDAQAAHGYLIRTSYIPTLRANFEACEVHQHRNSAIDQCWKTLQLVDKWYGFEPQLGTQAPGYSDIENREVNYGISR